jgi:hypothetical protein
MWALDVVILAIATALFVCLRIADAVHTRLFAGCGAPPNAYDIRKEFTADNTGAPAYIGASAGDAGECAAECARPHSGGGTPADANVVVLSEDTRERIEWPKTIRSINYSPTPVSDSYNTAQRVALQEAYRNARIADRLREYCGGDRDLLAAVSEYTLLNYMSFGEPYLESRLDMFAEPHASAIREIIRMRADRADHTNEEADAESFAVTIELSEVPSPTLWQNIDKPDPSRATYSYGNFSAKIPIQRRILLGYVSNDVDIMLALMRYHTILDERYHLTLELEEFKRLVARGVALDVFATPFNIQLLRVEFMEEALRKMQFVRYTGKYRFCSLLDTDYVFGSYGSFFNVDTGGKCMVVHPPAVESVLVSALQKCVRERSANPETRFVFYAPTSSGAYALAKTYAPDRVRVIPAGGMRLESVYGDLAPTSVEMFELDMLEPATEKK